MPRTGARRAGDSADPSQATKPVVFRIFLLIFENSVSSVEIFWPSATGAGSGARSRQVENGKGRKEIICFPLK